ncbi:MAG: transcription antitermination factor NusB [Chthoniobacterales bacterium]
MNARQLAHRCLYDWNQHGAGGSSYAEDIFNRLQLEWGFSGSERGFARELFYGVLRNLSALDFVIDQLTSRPPALEPRLALQLGLYQLLLLRTAAHAAVSETVDLVSRPQRGFVNGVLRRVTRELDSIEKQLAAQPDEIRLSHPDFLLEKWAWQYGQDAARQIAEWNNQPADVYLRRNTLVPEGSLEGLEPTAHPLVFRSTGPLQLTGGDFYVQDPSTLVAPELLAPLPHEHILDACAAPGGKTSYLAALMGNAGKITATDSDETRLQRLDSNLTRLGVTNTTIETHDWETGGGEPVQHDAILADVPCSNTGVMRRRIDVRWRLRPEAFYDASTRQLAILENLLPQLRPGGRLVYSTCSIDRSENEEVVETLLKRHPHLSLAKTERRLPHLDQTDGCFAALLIAAS